MAHTNALHYQQYVKVHEKNCIYYNKVEEPKLANYSHEGSPEEDYEFLCNQCGGIRVQNQTNPSRRLFDYLDKRVDDFYTIKSTDLSKSDSSYNPFVHVVDSQIIQHNHCHMSNVVFRSNREERCDNNYTGCKLQCEKTHEKCLNRSSTEDLLNLKVREMKTTKIAQRRYKQFEECLEEIMLKPHLKEKLKSAWKKQESDVDDDRKTQCSKDLHNLPGNELKREPSMEVMIVENDSKLNSEHAVECVSEHVTPIDSSQLYLEFNNKLELIVPEIPQDKHSVDNDEESCNDEFMLDSDISEEDSLIEWCDECKVSEESIEEDFCKKICKEPRNDAAEIKEERKYLEDGLQCLLEPHKDNFSSDEDISEDEEKGQRCVLNEKCVSKDCVKSKPRSMIHTLPQNENKISNENGQETNELSNDLDESLNSFEESISESSSSNKIKIALSRTSSVPLKDIIWKDEISTSVKLPEEQRESDLEFIFMTESPVVNFKTDVYEPIVKEIPFVELSPKRVHKRNCPKYRHRRKPHIHSKHLQKNRNPNIITKVMGFLCGNISTNSKTNLHLRRDRSFGFSKTYKLNTINNIIAQDRQAPAKSNVSFNLNPYVQPQTSVAFQPLKPANVPKSILKNGPNCADYRALWQYEEMRFYQSKPLIQSDVFEKKVSWNGQNGIFEDCVWSALTPQQYSLINGLTRMRSRK